MQHDEACRYHDVGSVWSNYLSSGSRDRLAFSKSILRRFIRDCVDRDAAVASPWTVKEAIAKHYGVDSIMPEETRRGVENIKKGEIDKRKKIWEDKEGPPTKKQKKLTAVQEERGELMLPISYILSLSKRKLLLLLQKSESGKHVRR